MSNIDLEYYAKQLYINIFAERINNVEQEQQGYEYAWPSLWMDDDPSHQFTYIAFMKDDNIDRELFAASNALAFQDLQTFELSECRDEGFEVECVFHGDFSVAVADHMDGDLDYRFAVVKVGQIEDWENRRVVRKAQ